MPDRDLAVEVEVEGTRWPLVGRRQELDRLATTVRGGGGSMVVWGDAGIGKSRLLGDFLAWASGQGMRTVLVRATRSTATIPFGPFASWTEDPVGPAATDRLQVLRTIARALLAGDGPVVVGVDDAHLLDEGSAALVLHVAAHTGARVVVTVRAGEPCPDAVVALWKEGLAELVELRPLAEPELAELAARVLQHRVDPALRRRLWALTRGTPLYLREVLRAAVEQRVLANEAGAWRWRGELTGGGRLADLLDDRLAHLGADERRTLELVALGEPLPLGIVARLDRLESLANAERHGLVVIGGPGDQLVARLAHPLYGEVLRAGVSSLRAAEHQRALAGAAVAVGWQHRDPLRVAAWWLESGAVPGPPEVFVAASRRALALGEWRLADRLGQAAEVSRAGPEATLTRAAALVHLGGWGEVHELLAAISPEALGPEALAEYARLRAGFLAWGQGRPAAGSEVLIEVSDHLPALARSRVLGEAAYISLAEGDLGEAARLATEAMNDAGPATELRVRAMAVAAVAAMIQGRTTAALRVAEMAAPFVTAAVAADPYPDNPAGLMGAAYCLSLVLDGRLDEAGSVVESALGHFEQHEVEARRSITASLAGRIALLQGRLAQAQRWAHEGLVDAGPGPGSQWPAAVVATAAAQLGDATTADEAIGRAEDTSPVIRLYQHELALARCWTRAARGELTAARAMASEAAARAAEAGAWLFEMLALLDLARLGAPGDAASRLAELSGVIDGAYAAAAAAYARAAADGDGEGLDRASERFAGMGAMLLAADAAATAATAHRAAGRRDRSTVAAASARRLAARCDGARTPALRALDTEPVWAALTGREREVIDLAARGLTNRQIATRLGVSIRTVSSHLHHAYTKLGSGDRAQLATFAGTTDARSTGPSP